MAIVQNEKELHLTAYKLYLKYRSCGKVAKKLGVSPTAVQNWKESFNWDKRVEEDIEKVISKMREEAIDEIAEIKKKQAKEGAELQLLGRAIVRKYLAMIQESIQKGVPIPNKIIEDISINIARMLLVDGIKIENLAVGEPTDKEEIQGEIDVNIRIKRDELREFTQSYIEKHRRKS